MREKLTEVLFSKEQIDKRVKELAFEINKRYAGQPLVVICVLKGAVIFFADLVRYINVRPELDFVRLASYGSGTNAGTISFTKDLEISLQGKHVIVVEDIVDTGHTMQFLFRQLEARKAKSIALCALIDKYERRTVDITVDFSGFKVNEGFIVGYGLDYAEKYRELPDIRILELVKD